MICTAGVSRDGQNEEGECEKMKCVAIHPELSVLFCLSVSSFHGIFVR